MKRGLFALAVVVICALVVGCPFGGPAAPGTFVVTTNPSSRNDWSVDIVIDGAYVYLVGEDESLCGADYDPQWRIEKRLKATGELVSAFGDDGIVLLNPTNSEDYPCSMAEDAGFLYVAGMRMGVGSYVGCIVKIDKSSGALDAGFGTDGVVEYGEQARFITADDDSLYIIDNSVGGRIAKLNKTNGAVVAGFGTSGAITAGGSFLAVDGSCLYAVGSTVCKYDKASGAAVNAFGVNGVVALGPNQRTAGIALDSDHVYIPVYNHVTPSPWIVRKLDIDTGADEIGFDGGGGSTFSCTGGLVDICVDSECVYLAGSDLTDIQDTSWRVERRAIAGGALCAEFGTNGVLVSDPDPGSGGDPVNALAIDGEYIYLLGDEDDAGDEQWRLEKRNKKTGGF